MSRFDDIADGFRIELEWATDGQVPGLLTEMELALVNQSAQDVAELNAFKICGCCQRIYSREEWEKLPPPANGQMHKADEYELMEYRNCNTPLPVEGGGECGATLVVVLEIYGGMPLPNSRHVTESFSHPTTCGGCRRVIPPGEAHATYAPRSSGLQQVAKQHLCESCDFTGRYLR